RQQKNESLFYRWYSGYYDKNNYSRDYDPLSTISAPAGFTLYRQFSEYKCTSESGWGWSSAYFDGKEKISWWLIKEDHSKNILVMVKVAKMYSDHHTHAMKNRLVIDPSEIKIYTRIDDLNKSTFEKSRLEIITNLEISQKMTNMIKDLPPILIQKYPNDFSNILLQEKYKDRAGQVNNLINYAKWVHCISTESGFFGMALNKAGKKGTMYYISDLNHGSKDASMIHIDIFQDDYTKNIVNNHHIATLTEEDLHTSVNTPEIDILSYTKYRKENIPHHRILVKKGHKYVNVTSTMHRNVTSEKTLKLWKLTPTISQLKRFAWNYWYDMYNEKTIYILALGSRNQGYNIKIWEADKITDDDGKEYYILKKIAPDISQRSWDPKKGIAHTFGILMPTWNN
ncbi:MAG: hypothetical protein ACRCTJ_06335, partial [Brevinema sp.]